MNLRSSVAVTAMLAAHPTAAQDHRFEADPVVTVRENFVACDVLSQLQRVMDDPRFLLTGECDPLSAGRRVRIYATRGPYVCIYPQDTITPCKWTHEKVLCVSPERQRAGGEHQHQWAGSRAVHPVRSMVLVISSARSGVRG